MLDWYFSRTQQTVWLGTAPNSCAEKFYRIAGWKEVGTHGKGEIKFEMEYEDWKNKQLEFSCSMKTYISILRGINVSGSNKIKMNDLKLLYEELEFSNVVTYIQSGNVIFKSSKNLSDTNLSNKIEHAILNKFKLNVPVIIRSIDELENVIMANPFIKQNDIITEKLHVTFLSEKPRQPELEKIKSLDYSPDKFVIKEKEIYIYCPNGYGNTRLTNNFFENKLKVKATTRNWRTANKLLELTQ